MLTQLIAHVPPAVVLTAALLLSCAACAQSAPGVPLREGNIYDHRDHQPTSAEEAVAGIAPISADAKRRVEQGVQRLLQQTDKLDGISDAQTRGGTARFSEQK